MGAKWKEQSERKLGINRWENKVRNENEMAEVMMKDLTEDERERDDWNMDSEGKRKVSSLKVFEARVWRENNGAI